MCLRLIEVGCGFPGEALQEGSSSNPETEDSTGFSFLKSQDEALEYVW